MIKTKQQMLKEAIKRFGLTKPLEVIEGGYQNDIFFSEKSGKKIILRITDSNIRSLKQVEGEIEWIEYLVKHNIPLAKPLVSKAGNKIEVFKINNHNYFAVLFEYAKGKKLTYPEYLGNVLLYEQLGEVTAKLHKASKNYNPKRIKRHSYYENYYLNNINTFIPKEKIKIHKAAKELINNLKELEKNETNYGLIHGDINVGNFHYDKNQITLFDFDECQYSWYIEDIAIQLYYTIFVFGEQDKVERDQQAKLFMEHFLKGYNKILTIDKKWLDLMSLFLKIRELIVYVGIYKKWDFNNLNTWQEDFLRDSTYRIENNISIYSLA
ncbi:MAG: phosphotransferase enzyme family protein [Bacillota bacterium]